MAHARCQRHWKVVIINNCEFAIRRMGAMRNACEELIRLQKLLTDDLPTPGAYLQALAEIWNGVMNRYEVGHPMHRVAMWMVMYQDTLWAESDVADLANNIGDVSEEEREMIVLCICTCVTMPNPDHVQRIHSLLPPHLDPVPRYELLSNRENVRQLVEALDPFTRCQLKNWAMAANVDVEVAAAVIELRQRIANGKA